MKRFLVSLFLAMPFIGLIAQINSTSSHARMTAEYDNSVSVFIFDAISSADLIVDNVDTDLSVSYRWQMYNSGINEWQNVGILGTALSNLESGRAYQLLKNDGFSETVEGHCWVFSTPSIDNFTAKEDTLVDVCSLTQFTISHDDVVVNYFDPANSAESYSIISYVLEWGDNDMGIIADTSSTKVLSANEAPYKNLDYKIYVDGKWNYQKPPYLAELDSTFVAKRVKASFVINGLDVSYDNEMEEEGDVLNDEVKTISKSGKWEVEFDADSLDHIELYRWDMVHYDHEGEELSSNKIYTDNKSFKNVGKYSVSMYVEGAIMENGKQCTDISDSYTINIYNSYIGVGNAFFPYNSTTAADEFREFKVYYHSIKSFKMAIYNRWGRMVFSSTAPEKTWDGKIGGTIAAPGVYFYVIEATGYDGYEHSKKGSVHLMP